MAAWAAVGLCCGSYAGSPLHAGDVGDGEVDQITIFLPSWSETPQQVQIREPNPKADAEAEVLAKMKADGDDLSTPATAKLTEASTAATIAIDDKDKKQEPAAPISTHLLIPQEAPPMPSGVYFPNLSPPAKIWLQGLAWIVEGQEFEAAGDIPQAISRFQNARSAYEQVERRFPDWQTEIIVFRIGDIEREIRRLVQKTATSAEPDSTAPGTFGEPS